MDTKRAAEELVLARPALDVVVVNPGAIFGPAERESNTVRFLRKLQAGRMPLAPPGALSVVGVEDVARGCILALARGQRGRRYLLVESVHACDALFEMAARALGGRPPLATVPRVLWPAVVASIRLLDAVVPQELVTPQSLKMLGLRFAFSAARARSELGWTPRPFPEVLAATIAGLREKGLLA
jgi:dihydroflavonol-4-reductase